MNEEELNEEKIISKTFPQNELQKRIYNFWKVRGWEEVRAVLGNLNVSLHKSNRYESLGLDYLYLEQFFKEARLEGFQKGKLEQKREDNNILIKYSKLRLYRSKSCQLLIKQLQKEIGEEKQDENS